MEELKGIPCESCGKEFEEKDIEEDGVVYCPACGAPVHRSCWNEKGGCPFKEKHSEGFVYQPPQPPKYLQQNPQGMAQPVQNNPSAVPVFPGNAQNSNQDENSNSGNVYDNRDNYSGDSDDLDNLEEALKKFIEGGEKPNKEKTDEDYSAKKYDGVSEREMMCFLNVDGPQKLYRLAVMKYMIIANKKTNFNLFAGLLNPYNQFYKGMTAFGVLLTFFNYIMGLPQLIAYYFTFFKDTTADTVSSVIDPASLFSLSNTLWIIQLVVVVLLCVFGDYLFINYMIKKIKKVRSRFEDEKSEDYLIALAQAGRPRLSLVVLGFVLQGFLSMLTIFICSIYGV